MDTLTLKLPTMYGDHHVVKVRQVVTALSGVAEVAASAALQQLTVTFDPAQTSAEAITSALRASGYAPGEAPAGFTALAEDLRHVVAAAQAEAVPERKYSPPPQFGACPGLEPRVIAGEHPADRKG
jgi:copper chaperone CopZ